MNVTRLLEVVQTYPLQAGILLLLFAFVYKASQAVYRLCFHPLSGFPGPREAALSDAWLWKLSEAGQQEQEFERLHEKYGKDGVLLYPHHCVPTNHSIQELKLCESAPTSCISQTSPSTKPSTVSRDRILSLKRFTQASGRRTPLSRK
jgi:hypothetical protein